MTGARGTLTRIRLAELNMSQRRTLTERVSTATADIRARARGIVEAVRDGGDAALREANARYGGGLREPADAPSLSVPRADLRAARDRLPGELRAALEHMAANIGRFHALQVPPAAQWVTVEPGIEVGRVWRGLDRVAAYVPGGTAAYPSSLLMSAIPARLAGAGSFVVASPASADGELSAALLGAAGLMEVDELWVMGGAQAVGALAYGTESIAPVDKIVGPGNAWVTAAKLEVLERCAIDMPAGPTEVMVVADETADPAHVAADLLSQAEHGPDSPALLVTPSEALAQAVEAELVRQLPDLARGDTLARSLAAAGTIVLTADIAEALAFADEYAPEHLSCVVADPDAALAALRHAGSLFLGAYAPESAGDYAAGSNHVLPTAGAGRAYSPLGVESFGRWMQVNRITREGLARIAPTVATVAEAEGLTAHRRAVEIRFEGGS
ncbi:MAG TPA: histidinol dehydrogenase [Candidatus Limnocylindrales bacterium]|nr:histidinol dehydrogenase [Candidatus Limnocylindrales bacterium]